MTVELAALRIDFVHLERPTGSLKIWSALLTDLASCGIVALSRAREIVALNWVPR